MKEWNANAENQSPIDDDDDDDDESPREIEKTLEKIYFSVLLESSQQ